MARIKAKQKGRILKQMICDCIKGQDDYSEDKTLFGCECMIKTKVKGKWVRSGKLINDIGKMDVSWLNSQNQNGEFDTNY